MDLQMASALPSHKRKAFLEEMAWETLSEEHISRGDGVAATFQIQQNAQTGGIRNYFVFDDGVDVTDDAKEWGRVTSIQFKADFDKRPRS